jgi:SAM-dependent methyltransferase
MPPAPTPKDVFQWDVATWSRALPLWLRWWPDRALSNALAIGEREGGLSLWLASRGSQVLCTDIGPLPPGARALHERYGVIASIEYGIQDVTAITLPDASVDVVVFKSVIGALGTRERQAVALREIHRVLRPGGVLLFAENLSGTWLHAALRRRFVRWEHYWRYLRWPDDRELFALFDRTEFRTTGLLHNLGRSEGQRSMLAVIDRALCALVPTSWRTVLYGACAKAG